MYKMSIFARMAFLAILSAFLFTSVIFAQAKTRPISSQEVSDGDGIPVIIKHLPDWESKQDEAQFINTRDGLADLFGDHPIYSLVVFPFGSEAVSADYSEGKLLIIEYATPQASIETDSHINEFLSEQTGEPDFLYRRIGNYNVFVFAAESESSANQLFDQVLYQKTVRWLGKDPFSGRAAERQFIAQTSSLFIATALFIVVGFGIMLLLGSIAGAAFYLYRRRNRASMDHFSDGGGLTRLNLDDLTPY